MARFSIPTVIAIFLFAVVLPAQQGDIRRARIKRIDLERGVLTLTVAGKDQDFFLTQQTQIPGASGKDLKERLQGFKEMEIFFKTARRDGKDSVLGMKPAGGDGVPAIPKVDTSKLRPLTELGVGEYQGFQGGLYTGGKNERPAAHETAGIGLARQVEPLSARGQPSADGKIVLLSVGMSNTTQEFSAFKRIADADADKNPKLVIVDGAQGGMSANRILNPDDKGTGAKFWNMVDQRLRDAGVTREQVQAAWIKQADPGPTQGFPTYARTLERELRQIVGLMQHRFPNLKLVYLSSRTYGGYAKTPLNPEPYAYESAFAVKWLIESQLRGDPALNYEPGKGPVNAPWLSWGPYLWANGTTPLADGLFYEESDFAGDGTHPSASGQKKVAERLLHFFKTDSTTKAWFLRPETQKKSE